MNGRERDNYQRILILLAEHSKEAVIDFFEFHLKNIKSTFENFINLYQHGIYHLYSYNTKCCKPDCKVTFQYPYVRKRILNASQLEILLDNRSSRQMYHKCSSTGDYCCCLAKQGIQTNVLDLTLANCLLINFCENLFWDCCSKPGQSLTPFLNQQKHTLFHLANIIQTCCMCDSTRCQYITYEKIIPYDMLLSLFNIPSSNSGNVCQKTGTQHICLWSPTRGLTPENLDNVYTSILQKQLCPNRKALDKLVYYRNKYGHSDRTNMPVSEYMEVKTHIEHAIMIFPKLPGKKEQTRETLKNFDNISLDERLRDHHRITLLEQIIRDEDLEGVMLTCAGETTNRLDHLEDAVLRLERSRSFHHVYKFAPLLFIQKQILSLSTADTSHLCDGGAKFKIKPASYPTSTVFMSLLNGGWIRFSETEQKYTEFKFTRVANPSGGTQFYYIKSVDNPKYYLTMGLWRYWVRAKFSDEQPIDDDSLWDIRCLKEGNESLYLFVPKNSKAFACVDCTRRLKGDGEHQLDLTKMFLFVKV